MHEAVVWDALALAAMAVAWLMAAFVYAAAPARTLNRLLALCLALEGFAHWISLEAWFHDPATVRGAAAVHVAAVLGLSFLYLLFLGTQDSPLARPFRRRAVRVAVLGAAVVAEVAWLLEPSVFLRDGPGVTAPRQLLYIAFGSVSLFGLAVALSALRRSPRGTLAHRRSKAFALGFGWRDAIFGAYLVPSGLLPVLGAGVDLARPFDDAPALATIGYVLLVGFGILRTQLFDIEVKVKWGIRRGTVAAMFLGVFFVVAQVAQNFLTDEFGWALGGLTAGLLLFAIAPMQRFAERVAETALPGVRSTAELSHGERAALYREQVQFAWSDGQLDASERLLLEHLRERLGVSRDEALRLEVEVTSALQATRSASAAAG